MNKRLSAVVVLALSPVVASATIIQVDYVGYVNSVSGVDLGYAINDPVSGTFFIDSTRAVTDLNCSIPGSECDVYSSADTAFVVGGQLGVGDAYPRSIDTVAVENNTGGVAAQDYFFVQNGSQEAGGGNYLYESLYVYDTSLDFITGTGLEQSFSLTSADLIAGFMYGGVIVYDSAKGGDGAALYQLTSINVSSRSAQSVPEPGTLSLLGAGLFGLALLRRRAA